MSKISEIKLKVSENKVVVYSKTYCPFCKKAKSALGETGLKDYVLFELDTMDEGDAYQDALKEITGARSVPRVFIGGKFVGGGDDVKALHSRGELKKMLVECGAL
ncbi:PREDICTED: glutaredoxin-like [Acropora digitifera]|uniref:glutaredoxin-like n=1 Tax=Acropora digitifera TaxID=70779 RepID=UPI00077ADEFB|nr:PREDICTED: glutaredoxin-like [Acropora digitifera]